MALDVLADAMSNSWMSQTVLPGAASAAAPAAAAGAGGLLSGLGGAAGGLLSGLGAVAGPLGMAAGLLGGGSGMFGGGGMDSSSATSSGTLHTGAFTVGGSRDTAWILAGIVIVLLIFLFKKGR